MALLSLCLFLFLFRVALLSCRDDADTAASTIPRGTVCTAASPRPRNPDLRQPLLLLRADGAGAAGEHAPGEQVPLSKITTATMEIATLSHARPLFVARIGFGKALQRQGGPGSCFMRRLSGCNSVPCVWRRVAAYDVSCLSVSVWMLQRRHYAFLTFGD